MADEDPGVIRITDHTGGIGRDWSEQRRGRILMLLAVVVVAIVLLLGAFQRSPALPSGPAMRPMPAPTTAQPIVSTALDMRRVEEEARDKDAAGRREPRAVAAPAAPVSGPHDPLAADRAKRRYESVLASPVVVSRRAAVDQPASVSAEGRRLPTRAPEAPPTLEETAAAVVRASQRASGGTAQGLPSLPAVTSPVTAPSQAEGRPEPTPTLDDRGATHTLLEGTILDAVLRIRLENSSNAPVKVMVTNPVYSHTGRYVLIPSGSELVGETKRTSSYGEDRAAVTFHRLIFPNGRTVPLRGSLGLNQAGDAGLKDQVNRHLASSLGVSAAIGAVTGVGQVVSGLGRAGNNSTVVIAGDVANSTSQSTQQVLSREFGRPWTITIREGKRIRVWLAEDLELPAYAEKERTP